MKKKSKELWQNKGYRDNVLKAKEEALNKPGAKERIAKVEDVLKVGDKVTVKVYEIDDQGRVNLTMKDLDVIRRTLTNALAGVHHDRVEYPKLKIGGNKYE